MSEQPLIPAGKTCLKFPCVCRPRLSGDKVLFMLELDYAGLSQFQNFSNEDMEAALLIECTRQIFPFARRIISDITRDGAFPPLLVDPIDFRTLYLTQKQRQAEAPATPPTASA